MATATSIISTIRSTASGPVMREQIALALELMRDGYINSSYTTASLSVSAEGTKAGNLSVTTSGYTPIGIIVAKPSNSSIEVSYTYFSGNTLYYKIYNPTSSAITATMTFTVLFKNNNLT